MNIEVIQLPADQWQQYRDIRLLALHTDPGAFGSTYEEEVSLSEVEWRHRIDAMWFAQDNGKIVGLAVFYQEPLIRINAMAK